MANFKYFADIDGRTIESKQCDYAPEGPRIFDPETGQWFPMTRAVRYKSNPSRHDCDARCIHAKGRTMNCECSCGGKNHGRGY